MPFGGQAAQDLAQFALRGQIERVGWLIEQKLARPMHQRARNQDAALFAGRHFADQLLRQVQRFHALQRLHGALAHFLGDMQIGPQRRRGKESRNHGIETGGDGGALARQLACRRARGDDAEVLAQLRQVPAFAAEDAHPHSRLHDGIDLAGHGEDQRGLSAAVGAENGHVLAGADAES